jgi:hypothetical protein
MTFTESYIALCREHPLERTWQLGDWHTWAYQPDNLSALLVSRDSDGELDAPEPGYLDADGYPACWLPRLDQLLDMLEVKGFREVRIYPMGADWRMDTADGPDKDRWLVSRPCSTREEAAYRLLLAVREAAESKR